MTQEEFYIQAGNRHNNGESWKKLIEDFYKLYHQLLTIEAIRKRVKRACNRNNACNQQKVSVSSAPMDYEAHNNDGSINATKTVLDNVFALGGDKAKILAYLGYSDLEWELVSWKISQWDGGIGGAPKYSIQYRLEPKGITYVNYLDAAQKAFANGITPLNTYKFDIPKGVTHKEKLMEIPPIELHLGKIADTIQTGEEYTLEIAKKRFNDICNRVLQKQALEKCGRCLIVVGSDFFNSESDSCTSVHKIPQQNSHGYIKLFTEGLQMYTSFLLSLRQVFKNVDVMLCAGNHARAMETYLYIALQQYFHDDKIVNFIENYRQTQCYSFGECAIFYNHGDAKLQQVIKSIPAEFGKEWGEHKFRELHLGHLHKEVTVDDDGGMITRRIGSPCSTDAWHAENRYIGATKKHEIFIWHNKYGLEQLYYINTKI